MIVCHCVVVRDHEIRSEVRLGATTVELVAQRCGAGSECGGCHEAIAQTILDETERAVGGAVAAARH